MEAKKATMDHTGEEEQGTRKRVKVGDGGLVSSKHCAPVGSQDHDSGETKQGEWSVFEFLTVGVWTDDIVELRDGLVRFDRFLSDERSKAEKLRMLDGVDAFVVLLGCMKKHASWLDILVAGFSAMVSYLHLCGPGKLGRCAVDLCLKILHNISSDTSATLYHYIYALLAILLKDNENHEPFITNDGMSFLCRDIRVQDDLFCVSCRIAMMLVGKDPARVVPLEENGFLIYLTEAVHKFRKGEDTEKLVLSVRASKAMFSALSTQTWEFERKQLSGNLDSDGPDYDSGSDSDSNSDTE